MVRKEKLMSIDRYGLIDWKAELLTPSQILELCKTPGGEKQVKEYILRARVAFATQEIMSKLGVVPPASVQQECCMILWNAIFRVPIDQVMEYAKQAAEGLAKETEGHC